MNIEHVCHDHIGGALQHHLDYAGLSTFVQVVVVPLHLHFMEVNTGRILLQKLLAFSLVKFC